MTVELVASPQTSFGFVCHAFISLRGGEVNAWQTNPKGRLRGGYRTRCTKCWSNLTLKCYPNTFVKDDARIEDYLLSERIFLLEALLQETDDCRICLSLYPHVGNRRGGDSANERGGDASRKFWNKPLKETHLGVAKAFYTDNIYIFSRATLNKTFTAKYDGALPRIP